MALKTLKQTLYELDRKFMPQVKGSNLKDAVSLLKQNGITVKSAMKQSSELRHSQDAVDKEKVKSIIKAIQSGQTLPPLIISQDNYVVDGHHRWIAYKYLKMPMNCIQIMLPQKEAIIEFKKIEGQLQ